MRIEKAIREIDRIVEEGSRSNSMWSPKIYYKQLKYILELLKEDNEEK